MKKYERTLAKIERLKQDGFPLSGIVQEFYRLREPVQTEPTPVWEVYNDRKNEKLYMVISNEV